MDKVKIILENGIEKEVYGIFYLYNSKYYFIYTEKETDESGYVILHIVQVGKEVKNTDQGPVDTGYMIGVEINEPAGWGDAQKSITMVVEDKKNNTQSQGIQYLSTDMLSTLKIVSKKTFRLMRSIVEDDFKVELTPENKEENIDSVIPKEISEESIPDEAIETNPIPQNQITDTTSTDNDVIVDYRAKYFEEQQKNIDLQAQIDELNNKIESIKKIIE